MRTRLFNSALMAMLMTMCLISENVGNKLDIIAMLLFVYAMNQDEDGRL